MRYPIALTSFLLLAAASHAQEISSAYTKLEPDQTCAVIDKAGEGDGDWADLACSGYKGYPVLVRYGDARESLFYGFPPQAGLPWESFAAFNSSGPTVEWRIEKEDGWERALATIHRRFVAANPEKPEAQIEVLVVSKVGQLDARQGCVVGYVVATGNPGANEKARHIADEKARTFNCGKDKPSVVSGSTPLPELSRSD
ncbi:hypothetical protein [Chelativorans sp. J32]|uniref:hypothetical protein n=1 Tax=Chelativorans sp. J32 TaxID=935840 RepID=UPI00048718C4|nr:hypothetical protein [Chelativorans sp. J32]